MTLTVGVIAVQGDVSEHEAAIRRAAHNHDVDPTVREIRTTGEVPDCDVLLMPGGESTTISRLLQKQGIDAEIRSHVEAGNPLFATCAGLIVASRNPKDDRVRSLDLLDISIDRNAFGRQRDSFETQLRVDGLEAPFPSVFIRAPLIDTVGSDVEVLAEYDGSPVAVQEGPVVGTSFHPELTSDTRLHGLALFDTDRS
ncbi:pyridoxal 5'-phosphate synthase glutaminase subunit PdxT [Halocatena pleomorpha]|uniref:Pyridoxal 5'-phosphate synthase subunit PdxT n=1 Tax=Halocatena pleomorpha TaxID=1785090 RepID=A0A3P3RKT4_9EURY|nr:pyridoxal 5'-phosphate synthase glutaminase subunit PdxT [Halocatena pleomorpha]RRJ33508.1 pyridoxal 5'-phosphate synthase glutaminase subunit PdxT [Halocatena pleomorpha]